MTKKNVGAGISRPGSRPAVDGPDPAHGGEAEAQMFRSLADRSPEFIGMCDLELNPFYVNEAGRRLVGLESLAEACAAKVQDYFFPEDQRQVSEEFLPKVRSAGQATTEIRFRHFKTGAAVWVIWDVFRLGDAQGQATGYASVGRDITAWKRTETALRESHERLQRVLEVENVGVMFWDLTTGCMTDANETFLKMMGYSRREVEARELSWQKLTPPEYVDASLAEIRKFMATGRVGPYEKEYWRKDGTRQWLVFAGSSLGANACVEFCVDISARKEAEAALRRSEERFDLAVRSAGAGIWDYDVASGRVYFSPRWKSMFGYEEQEIGDTVEDWARLLHPEDKDEILKLQADFLAGSGSMLTAEYRLRHKDGCYRWIEAQGLVVRDGNGHPRRFVGSHADITERKQAQEALDEATQRLSYHVQNTPLAVIEFDPDLRVRAWSDGAQRIFGWPAAEVVGRLMWEIPWICEEDRGKVQQVSAGLESGTTVRSVSPNRNLRKDGTVIWCEWYNSSLTDAAGRVQSIQSLVLDVTERKRAEDAFRQSEERFRVAQEMSPDGFTILRPVRDQHGAVVDFTWVYENDACGRMNGTNPAAVVGQRLLDVFPSHRTAEIFRTYREVTETRRQQVIEAYHGEETKFPTWFRVAVVPVGNDIAVLTQDITRQKEFQLELEKLVASRTAKLQELVQELEHFSYTITHDLKSPLRAMKGYAEMALELSAEAGTGGETSQFLRRISTAADRMDALIRDALNYSRAVRQELPLDDIDTDTLLRGMLDSYPELQPSRAQIRVEGRLPVVVGNEAGLTQCFSNLLSNAVKFVGPGETPDVRIWAEQREGWARIWIEDQGIGISGEMLPRVFDMFSRESRNYEGTGIGLALVRKVTQRMGGKIGVESQQGKGSRFWFELKLGEVRAAVGEALPAIPALEGGTILYVEDEENDAMFMERAFARKGLTSSLHLVSDGRAAIDYLSGTGKYGDRLAYPLPTLVLLDLNLPAVSGFEVLKWMRNHPDFARLPVVVFTSSALDDDRVKARDLGADEFVVKPKSGTDFGDVVEKLREVERRSR